ncbi:MAG: hypothetical protein HY835_04655 [Anaerolineae bacterium]|nr:hypothetical protein [Anaerolineae bacterium]
MVYQIRTIGVLDETWSAWLGDVKFCTEKAEDGSVITTLTVDLIDQAALYGILDHLRDLNLRLVSVNELGAAPAD